MLSAAKSALSTLTRRVPAIISGTSGLAFVHASTALPAMEKLRYIIQDYNEANFKQGLPSNFVARLLEETDENEDGLISATAAQRTLRSLGYHDAPSEHPLTPEDASAILREHFGVRDEAHDHIPMDQFMRLFFENVPKKKTVVM